MIQISRRVLLVGAAGATLLPHVAFARDIASFVIDWQGGPQTPEVAASLASQIATVQALAIKPDIAAFFAAQIITIDLADDTHTRAGPRGVFFERRAMPPENPVLLHELLHRYHMLRLPDGRQNAQIIQFYEQAKASGRYPANAYMLTNPMEFFAMTASVVLHGKAARPPSTRATVGEKSPELYRWIVTEFGLRV